MVLGGAGLVMFGMVAATGIRILSSVDFAKQHNNNQRMSWPSRSASASSAGRPRWTHMPENLRPLMDSGILPTALSAVVLNIFFNGARGDTRRRRGGEGLPGLTGGPLTPRLFLGSPYLYRWQSGTTVAIRRRRTAQGSRGYGVDARAGGQAAATRTAAADRALAATSGSASSTPADSPPSRRTVSCRAVPQDRRRRPAADR